MPVASFRNVGVVATADVLLDLVPYLKECGFHVRAIWCENAETCVQIASDFEVPFVAPVPSEVILRKDVEMVIATDYPLLHAQVMTNAVGVGKHVLVNSPVIPSADVLEKLEEASASYYPQLLALFGFGFRQLDIIREMKTAVSKGIIGNVTTCELRLHCGPLQKEGYGWLCDSDSGGGALNLVGSQFIDLARYLTGEEAVHVFGHVKTTHIANETCCKLPEIYRYAADDFVVATLDMTRGVLVQITVNTIVPRSFLFEVVLCGSKGRLRVANDKLFSTIFQPEPAEDKLIYESPMLKMQYAEETGNHIFELLETSFFTIIERLQLESNDSGNFATMTDMLKALKTINVIRKSSLSGRSLCVDE